jgi:hypothetical protein
MPDRDAKMRNIYINWSWKTILLHETVECNILRKNSFCSKYANIPINNIIRWAHLAEGQLLLQEQSIKTEEQELVPPLWSSGQRSCLQIQRPGFDSRRYQIFREIVALKLGPLSLVSTVEELLEIKSSGSGLEKRDYGRRDSSRWQRGTLYPQ